MARLQSHFLSLALIFVTGQSMATPLGAPEDYNLTTKYSCQVNGVSVHSQNKLVSHGDPMQEVIFAAKPGANQALSLNDRQYMIWPRVTKGSFEKSLSILSKDTSQKYQIMQEIDLGNGQKTKTNVGVTVKDRKSGEERLVTCRVELEWLKKTR